MFGHVWACALFFCFASEEYGRFFQLVALRPELALVPSVWVEKVWQRHILDTQEYTADCGAYLPTFLHYNPNREEEVCFCLGMVKTAGIACSFLNGLYILFFRRML